MEALDRTDFQNSVEPFYFGEASRRLYGCHHLPQVADDRNSAVVICSPIGQEYQKSHRVLYQLAVLLSKVGFHVLRFDYFGCGDSQGNFEQGSIIQWNKDILTAIEEIQHRSGIKKVCLIGLRLGAALALQTASHYPHIISLVLWEPVLKGEAYIKQLQALHQKYMSHFRYQEISVNNQTKAEITSEVFGYAMTPDLREELNMIKVGHLSMHPWVRLLALLNSEESLSVNDLTSFAESNPQAEVKMIAEQSMLWREFNKRLTPMKSIRFIVNWVGSVNI